MKSKEIALALKPASKQLTDLILLMALCLFLGIPSALAHDAQEAPKERTQASVPVTSEPNTERTLTQALDDFEANNTVDFLMEKPPLTQSTSTSAPSPTLVPVLPSLEPPDAPPEKLQVLQGVPFPKTDEVAMLVSEKCTQTGKGADSANFCSRVYSNGHHTTILTQNASEGDQIKQQTVIEEFDSDLTLLYRKTIRHRIDHRDWNGQKTKEKEFFDIITQPAQGKTVREFMVYEYFLDTGKTRSLSWTQYQQVDSEPRAELTYHAILRYGDDGSPDRGTAEQWSQGKKTETLMNWSRRAAGFATWDETNWAQWESWIQSIPLQAYLP